MSDSTQKVEVFQPRDANQFYDEERPRDEQPEIYEELRDLSGGFVDAEDLDYEMFGRCYDLVGAEEVEAGDEDEALNQVWQFWQNNGGLTPTSDVFRESNNQERATSLSAGDIIRVNGTAYLCASFGWDEVEEVSL